MKSPLKFLDAYQAGESNIFFGREKETDVLFDLVFKSPLVLVYGLSGTGKTSLVQCGLSSRFDGPDWYPFFIRRQKNIVNSLNKSLIEVFPTDETWDEDDYSSNVNAIFEEYLRPVYLIFDQLEELFILGDLEEQEKFAQIIHQLIKATLPCRVILIIREEFLGQLYYIEQTLPMIYDFKLRIESMGLKKVKEVISGTFSFFNVIMQNEDKTIRLMYEKLSAGKSGVQLPHLQVYLDMLYRKDFKDTYPDLVDQDEYQNNWPPLEITQSEVEQFGNIEEVLAQFLEEQQEEIQNELSAQFHNLQPAFTTQFLDIFVTEEGTKRPVYFTRSEGQILLETKVLNWLPKTSTDIITLIIEKLISLRLIRATENYLEFSHDILAYLIDKERGEYHRKLSLHFSRVVNAFKSFPETKEYLSRAQLNIMDEFLPDLKTRLDDQLWQFVEQSKLVASQKEKQELLKEKKRKRVAVFLAALGFTLAGMAFIGFTLSKINADKAKEQAIEAHINYGKALKTEWRFEEAQQQLNLAKEIAHQPEEKRRINNLKRNWDQIDSLIDYSEVLFKQDSILQARQKVSQAFEISPDTTLQMQINSLQIKLDSAVQFHLTGAKSNLGVGKIDEAKARFLKALQFDPNNKEAIQALKDLEADEG